MMVGGGGWWLKLSGQESGDGNTEADSQQGNKGRERGAKRRHRRLGMYKCQNLTTQSCVQHTFYFKI